MIFKNHHTLIGKYIFVIFLSLFVIRSFVGMGVGKGGQSSPGFWNLTFSHQIFCKKGCCLSFEWWKCNFSTSGHPAKIFLAHPWKIHYWPLPGKKTSGVHAHLSKCWRGAWPEKVGNPWSIWIGQTVTAESTKGKLQDQTFAFCGRSGAASIFATDPAQESRVVHCPEAFSFANFIHLENS